MRRLPLMFALLIAAPAGAASAMDRATFEAQLLHIQKTYEPEFARRGLKLKIQGDWDSSNAGASSSPWDGKAEVKITGGLARHPLMTSDAVSLVICHELGHFVGGSPRMELQDPETQQIIRPSAEGQADYFATLKCAREIWKNDDNLRIVASMQVSDRFVEACRSQFRDAQAAALCQRSSMAALSMAMTLASRDPRYEYSGVPDFITSAPDRSQVSRTELSYSFPQCRLDTSLAGALCPVSRNVPLSDVDPTQGTCSEEKGDRVGFRPRCWYKPLLE